MAKNVAAAERRSLKSISAESEPDPTDLEKYRRLYDTCYHDIWLYCLRRTATRSQAEELLGDTFTTAWEKIDHIPPGGDARPWLYGVARNHVHNEWRKAKRRKAIDLSLISKAARSDGQDTGPGPEALALDETNTIVAAFKNLGVADQEILSLASWEKLSNSEIGLTLGCSTNAAKIRLHRARKRLSKELQKQGNAPISQDAFPLRNDAERKANDQ